MVTTHAPGGEVVLSRLVKSGGRVRAVRSIDLTISHGETVTLLGPNGAGKSTTIDMVPGLTRPDAGSVTLFGFPLCFMIAMAVLVPFAVAVFRRDTSRA